MDQVQLFEVGRDTVFQQTIFTEGRKGNEATGVGSYEISKQALFLHLAEKFQRRFAIFCSNKSKSWRE